MIGLWGTYWLNFLEADSSFRVFLDRDLPVCSARRSVEKRGLRAEVRGFSIVIFYEYIHGDIWTIYPNYNKYTTPNK